MSMEDIQLSDVRQQNATICQDSLCIFKLRSEDGRIFRVSDSILRQSMLLAGLLEESSNSMEVLREEIISMPLRRQILKAVLEYCAYHAGDHAQKEYSEVVSSKIRSISPCDTFSIGIRKDLQRKIPPLNNLFKIDQWDENFITTHWSDLIKILKAADYLLISGLAKLIFHSLAELIAPMDPQEVREFFDIEDDLTGKEKGAIIETFPWVKTNKAHDIKCHINSSRACESSLRTYQRIARTQRISGHHPYMRRTLQESMLNVE